MGRLNWIARADGRRAAISIVAALMFMLHALGGAWASATPMPVDAFGNPLCISDQAGQGNTAPDRHSGFPDCCTLACHASANLLLPPRDASVPAAAFRTISEPLGVSSGDRLVLRSDAKQGNPRAPPSMM
ncbi:MAG: hypothetical protein M9924_01880 [Rhizobiaceae bacterium]|nr:hypothetical protein [Rhizobiaceae bacterium]